MAFNPQDILSKIRKKEYTASKTVPPKESLLPERRPHHTHFISGSSSSSGNMVQNSFEQPPSDQEYIGSLLSKIQLLERKVNGLELELSDAKNQISVLRVEKNHLETELLKRNDHADTPQPQQPRPQPSRKPPSNPVAAPENSKNAKKPPEDYFSFNDQKAEFKEKVKKTIIEKEQVDEFLKGKEKNYMVYGSSENTKRLNKYKTPGYLKTDVLEGMLKTHPELGKPTITIKIREEDLE